MLKSLFCKHEWYDIDIKDIIKTDVVSDDEDEDPIILHSRYRVYAYCKKCNKIQKIEDGASGGLWGLSKAGSTIKLLMMIDAMGIKLFFRDDNGGKRYLSPDDFH